MGLSDFSVKRPVAISMVFLTIVLIGLVCLARLPIELMPNISFGEITIIVEVRGGIPSAEIEERVTKPIEEAVGAVTHIKNILTISKEGNSTVILEFEPGTNMDFAALEVRENFARIKDKLPREIEKPIIAKYEYLDVPIMILAVTGTEYTPEQLRRMVDEAIKKRISRVDGVAKVEVSGGRERKILIEVDQWRLQAHSLSIERVIGVLNLNNLNLLAGDIKRAKDKYLVRAIGEFKTLQEIEQIGVAITPLGSIIHLKDVATVEDSYLEPTSFARMNIRPVVNLYVLKESMANTVRVARGVQKELDHLKPMLPGDVEITPTFNQADFVRKAIDTVKSALLYGAVLAVLVLAIFLADLSTTRILALSLLVALVVNMFLQLVPQPALMPMLFSIILVILFSSVLLRDLRPTFVIALTIPIAVLATFSLMYFMKITLNVMTLCGLALGVGMLVDSSIVVLENIFKKREEKLNEFKAAPQLVTAGAKEVALAIFASTVTTIIVFLPIIFVNKEIQMLYSGLALTVTFSLLASLFVSLTLVPMLSSRFRLRVVTGGRWRATSTGYEKSNAEDPIQESKTKTPDPGTQRPKDLGRNPFFFRLQGNYRKALTFVIGYRWLFILLAFGVFAHAVFLSTKLEREFIGIAEQNRFTIFIQMPTGTRLEVSDQVVSRVEKLLTDIPEIKTATARVDPWSSKIYVELVPLNQRKRSTAQTIEALRPGVEKIQPAFIYFEESQEVGTKEVLLEIYGHDYEILKGLAIEIASRLGAIEKLTDVKIRMREGRPEMRLVIDKQRAALFGLTVGDIAEVIHAQMRGMVATRYHSPIVPLVRLKGSEGRGLEVRRGRYPVYSLEEKRLLDRKLKEFRSARYPGQPDLAEVKEIETIARLEEEHRRTFDDLHRLTFATPSGDLIYLKQISAFNLDIGPSEIWRKNKTRMVQVSANTGGMPLGTVARKIREGLTDLKFPKDYFYRFGGNYDKMIRNQKELSFAFWLTLVLVFMVLASLFESYHQPFIIMISVPLAAIGVVSLLTLAHNPVGIGVLIGCIMLAGIVVNNAIILVDRINRYRRDSTTARTVREAVLTACQDRLRPILMTTSTTVLGLLPMALDKSEAATLWSPLALTVIGGLISSTFLTLFILPSIYLFFNDVRNMLKGGRK